jgi:hypothetical protein
VNQPIPPTDTPQSFVIRMWRESPRKWRGTVRHVQSEAQRGFERLDQAFGFIEQRTFAPPSPIAQKAERRSLFPPLDWSWLGTRRMQPVWALAGLVVLLAVTLLLVNPNANVPLAGAAIGGGDECLLLSAFVCGAVVGGVGVALWFRSQK